MKNPLILIMLSFSMLTFSIVNAFSGEAGPVEIVQKFYQASAEGDVQTMKIYATGPFYERRKMLIEQNQGYADFLRDHYSGVMTEIVSADIEDIVGKAAIVVKITYRDGSNFDTTLFLKKDNNGMWKINDERLAD